MLKNGVTKLDDTINKIPGIGPKKGNPKSKKQTEVEKRAAEKKANLEKKLAEKGKTPKAKRLDQHKEFVKKWTGKSIKNLGKSELVEALTGFTKQGNKVAKAIANNEIKIHILDSKNFLRKYKELGGDSKNAKNLTAYSHENKTFFRNNTMVEEYFSELIHEGTHALDYIEDFTGNNHSWEKRAYFFERQFQLASGKTPDFGTIVEMITHIKNLYKKF